MFFDFNITGYDENVEEMIKLCKIAENLGFDCIWISEIKHDPFLRLMLIAEHTERIKIGTSIALAFTRSPMTLAYTAWDLQNFSRGRLILGLGSQVKAHLERRFSVDWKPPAPRMKEFILALRAIWDCWQYNKPLNYRGEYYKLDLMIPFFNPGPINYSKIPIFIAGVNPIMCRVAGELCDGLHVHPLHSLEYLRKVIIPNVEKGLKKSGRNRSEIQLSCSVFVATGKSKEDLEKSKELVKDAIAFYGSTPTYRAIFELHGLADLAKKLSEYARQAKWKEMRNLISDEILENFAIVGTMIEASHELKKRYEGILDRVSFYPLPTLPNLEDPLWKEVVRVFK
jgi:probable F420-dependent oxidoreductase